MWVLCVLGSGWLSRGSTVSPRPRIPSRSSRNRSKRSSDYAEVWLLGQGSNPAAGDLLPKVNHPVGLGEAAALESQEVKARRSTSPLHILAVPVDSLRSGLH